MVMEALEGYGEKFKYDVFGHSGEESALQFVKINNVCVRFVITFTIKNKNFVRKFRKNNKDVLFFSVTRDCSFTKQMNK